MDILGVSGEREMTISLESDGTRRSDTGEAGIYRWVGKECKVRLYLYSVDPLRMMEILSDRAYWFTVTVS